VGGRGGSPAWTSGRMVMKCANRWLGWLAAVVLGFGGLSPVARAETDTVDGIEWSYSVSGGVATVSGIPASTTGARRARALRRKPSCACVLLGVAVGFIPLSAGAGRGDGPWCAGSRVDDENVQ
jgi:hypothetical protein